MGEKKEEKERKKKRAVGKIKSKKLNQKKNTFQLVPTKKNDLPLKSFQIWGHLTDKWPINLHGVVSDYYSILLPILHRCLIELILHRG